MSAAPASPVAATRAALPRPGSLGAWVLACRPKTLPVAVAPVLVGGAVASGYDSFRPTALGFAMLGALLLQIGANLANDVFDFEKGADDATRLGPTRAVQAGLLTPRQVRVGMAFVFALAVGVGAYLATVGGWPIIAIGVASILSAVAYTGGPYPLGYHGLGDLFVFVFFGPVAVIGTTYVASGATSLLASVASAAPGAISAAVLVVNNVRDHASDRRTGKRTLVARFGAGFGRAEYVVLLTLAQAAPVVAVVLGLAPVWALLSVATLPRSLRLVSTLHKTEEGPALNALLAETAQLMLAHAVLFSLGLVVARYR